MDLLLRNIDVVAVKKIDELAKARKMSRQEFLKIHIEKFAMFDAHKEERNRFEDSLQMVAEVLFKTMKMIQEQQEEIQKMKTMFMMVMDIDEEEMSRFIEDFILREGEGE